jgi:hypothetical protein
LCFVRTGSKAGQDTQSSKEKVAPGNLYLVFLTLPREVQFACAVLVQDTLLVLLYGVLAAGMKATAVPSGAEDKAALVSGAGHTSAVASTEAKTASAEETKETSPTNIEGMTWAESRRCDISLIRLLIAGIPPLEKQPCKGTAPSCCCLSWNFAASAVAGVPESKDAESQKVAAASTGVSAAPAGADGADINKKKESKEATAETVALPQTAASRAGAETKSVSKVTRLNGTEGK